MILDWHKIYGKNKPRRISLPTYPFARERYWIEAKDTNVVHQQSDIKHDLHPLVHENTSNFSEQRFSTTFTGDEFFLQDHQVQGQKVLPGVVYLEMVRAAIQHASGKIESESCHIRLKNIVWAKPITVDDDLQTVHISLFPEENGDITYEIYTQDDNKTAEPQVHSQGAANFGIFDKPHWLDITVLQNRMHQRELTSAQCYTAFKAMGIEYCHGHQGIESLSVGDHEVLAKLTLPSLVADPHNQFMLHPSLLDSALQASIGLTRGLTRHLRSNPHYLLP